MKNGLRFFAVCAAVIFGLGLLSPPAVTLAAPRGAPIVIGYVGDAASPGTRPCIEIQKMAVAEINAAGGIMGRPVNYIVMDGKGDPSLSAEAARKLIVEDKAIFISVEGRTEIGLAVQEISGRLFKKYPHILQFNGATGSELTARIVDQYPRYEHCFRDSQPEAAYWAHMLYYFTEYFQRTLKAKKLAILWDDLAWTQVFRQGIPSLELPPWEQMARECGLEVVYSKAVQPRGILYFPILQQIADAEADLIFFVNSWSTDTESFVRQWADSAAKDIPVHFEGGAATLEDFWKRTDGKALGIVSSLTDLQISLTPKTIPLMKKARAKDIPMQLPVHLAYADIYHFKAAIDQARGTSNIQGLIKAMETVETVYSLGKMRYQTSKKIKPLYHSAVRVDPDNLYEELPGYFLLLQAQFQKGGEILFISDSCYENVEFTSKFWNPGNFKPPAELRKK